MLKFVSSLYSMRRAQITEMLTNIYCSQHIAEETQAYEELTM